MTLYKIFMNMLNVTSEHTCIAAYEDKKVAEDLALALNEGQEHLTRETQKYFTVFKEEE